jgi:hypothetical protein
MSSIEITFDSYREVATFNGQRPLFYQEFGSYQGEWVLFALGDEDYVIYRDWYGSCSGCDSLQADCPRTQEQAEEFARAYRPFCEIPRLTASKLAQNGTFETVFPANFRDGGGVDLEGVVDEIETLVKLEEELPVTAEDAWRAKSQETRRRVLEKLDVQKLIDSVREIDGDDSLVVINKEVYLWLKDSSTPRRYLLRVPPEMKRVREAKAWTFGLSEDEYAPLIET